ncbi:MAG: Vps62-related protein [Myxococcaceae bacterium]|nr:Vps62-related protein [Myxococcaceae bacterium]
MEVAAASTQLGASIRQWSCNGGDHQKFRLEPTATVGNVLYGRWSGSGGRDPGSPNNPSLTVSYAGPTSTVTFSLSSAADTYLYLLDSSGNLLGEDDDGGTAYDSRLSVTLSTGTYRLVAATFSAGQTADFTVSSDKATLSYPQMLYVQQVGSFVWIYDDASTGADDDVSVWRPNLSQYPGYYSLGDVAMQNHGGPPRSTFVVKGEGDLLAMPIDYTWIWNDKGSGGEHDGAFWAPVAPAGYTCLGHVATPNYSKPSTDLIRCIKSSYVLSASSAWVWDDSGSHADDNVSLYQANPKDHRGLAVSTFVSLPHYDGDGGSSRYWVLNKSATANLELKGLPVNALTAAALAPRVWLDPDEDFFPSSTQFFLNNVHQSGGFLVTNEGLGCDNCTNPAFLDGQRPAQTRVPVYAEIVQRTQNGQPTGITDIIYWMFYPYNNGKLVCVGYEVDGNCVGDRVRFGNHVGDWEHMTVRFVDGRPSQIHLAQHSHGQTFVYGDKVLALAQGRPTLYAADGSHGLYADEGRHVYQSLDNGDELVDDTGAGMLWDTGSTVVPFEWQTSGTYTGSLDWLNITSRWGNPKSGCAVVEDLTGECVLNDGPQAPMSKGFSQPSSMNLE